MQSRQRTDDQAILQIQDPHFFLAVHIGAGRHSHKMEQAYKDGKLPSYARTVAMAPAGLYAIFCCEVLMNA